MSRPAEPSDRSPRDCAFCTCFTPRFDVVTLKSGERHSEFCCACGRPGASDVISGQPVVDMPEPMQEAPVPGETFVRLGDAWRKATMADEQRMLLHYMQTGEWPRWCSHGLRHALGSGDVTRLSSEALEPHPTLRREDLEHYARTGHEPKPRSPARFQRIWRSFPSYDAISNIEGVHIADMPPPQVTVQDPAQVIATYRDAAVPGQRYERPIYSMVRPAPYDAVLAQVGGSEVLPELAPSFVGCLRAIFVYRSILIPWFLACYDNGPNERLVIEAERSVMAEMVHGTLEQRIRLEARVDENLRWYEERNHHQRVKGLKTTSNEIVPSRVHAMDGDMRSLRVRLRGVPPYRDAGRAIGQIYGSTIHQAQSPVHSWSTAEPIVINDDIWVNPPTLTALSRVVGEANDDRRRRDPGAVPLRVIIPVVNTVHALLDDMSYLGIQDHSPMRLFDSKTTATNDASAVGKRFRHGALHLPIDDAHYYVGVDLGIGPYDQGKTVIARQVDVVVTLEAIDDTPPDGWTQDEICGRLRAIYATDEQKRVRELVKARVKKHTQALLRGFEVEVSDVNEETLRARVAAAREASQRSPSSYESALWAALQPTPSLFIEKFRPKKEDGPSYQSAFESFENTHKDGPLPAEETFPVSTPEGNVCTFAYAPGERDAYPVGQAPGEKLCWPDPMGDPDDDAPPAWTPWRPR